MSGQHKLRTNWWATFEPTSEHCADKIAKDKQTNHHEKILKIKPRGHKIFYNLPITGYIVWQLKTMWHINNLTQWHHRKYFMVCLEHISNICLISSFRICFLHLFSASVLWLCNQWKDLFYSKATFTTDGIIPCNSLDCHMQFYYHNTKAYLSS